VRRGTELHQTFLEARRARALGGDVAAARCLLPAPADRGNCRALRNPLDNAEPSLVAKPEWGTKRICLSCGARFYDLQRSPIVCPACGAVFDLEVAGRARRARPAARSAVTADVEEAVVDETELAVVAEGDLDETEAELDEDTELADEGDEDDQERLIEDASELGEDEDDVGEVIDGVDEDEAR
jgi:uncharacterized protein (TIGR02300 family)